MKISEGIKHVGRPFEIPDCDRRDLPRFFKEMGYKVGAEIGVFRGEFTKRFCQEGLKMYAIDPWIWYDDYVENSYQAKLDKSYALATERLKDYDCEIIRKFSMDAVKDFDNDSLDFVYIDGNHGFKHVTEDIYEWSKKVRKGGVISGHDYTYLVGDKLFHCDVKWVVDAYTKAIKKSWFVLGRKETLPNEKRDRHRSFMWFK